MLAAISDAALPVPGRDAPIVPAPAFDGPGRACSSPSRSSRCCTRSWCPGRAPLPSSACSGSSPGSAPSSSARWAGRMASRTRCPLLVQLVALALSTGGVFAAMILGHWYLVTPKLPTQPLVLFAQLAARRGRRPARPLRRLARDRRRAGTARRSGRSSATGRSSSGCACSSGSSSRWSSRGRRSRPRRPGRWNRRPACCTSTSAPSPPGPSSPPASTSGPACSSEPTTWRSRACCPRAMSPTRPTSTSIDSLAADPGPPLLALEADGLRDRLPDRRPATGPLLRALARRTPADRGGRDGDRLLDALDGARPAPDGTIVTIDPDGARTDRRAAAGGRPGSPDERISVVDMPALDAFAADEPELRGPVRPRVHRRAEAGVRRLRGGARPAPRARGAPPRRQRPVERPRRRRSGFRADVPSEHRSADALRAFDAAILADPRFVATIIPIVRRAAPRDLRG